LHTYRWNRSVRSSPFMYVSYTNVKNERLKRRHLIFKFQCHLLRSNLITFIGFTGSSRCCDATGVIFPRRDLTANHALANHRESSRIVASMDFDRKWAGTGKASAYHSAWLPWKRFTRNYLRKLAC